jgi:hypothetical protein
MSDDQLTDKALEMWSNRNNDKAFHLLHMWKVVRGEQKWSAYLSKLKKENEKSKKDNPAQVANLDLGGEKRPVGHKKAKKNSMAKGSPLMLWLILVKNLTSSLKQVKK